MDNTYPITILQNEIKRIDKLLENKILLQSELNNLEEKRKSIQVAIYQLLKMV